MNLIEPKLRRDYFHLLWPLLVEQLFLMLIGNVNVYLLSLFNDEVVAAIGMADQVLAIATMAMGIVSLGSTILFLQNADEGRLDTLHAASRQTILLNLILGLIMVLVAKIFAPGIMGLMQTPADIRPEAILYLRVVSFSLVFQALSTSASALLRAFGQTKVAMTISVVNTLMVIAGNSLVVFGPASLIPRGIESIALATVVTRALGMVLSMLAIRRVLPQVWSGLFGFKMSDWQVGRQILALGIPSGMENVSYNFSQTVITALIASLGSAQVSARIYTQTITAVVFTLSVAAGQAGQVIVGRLNRQGDRVGARDFSWHNTLLFMGLGASINLVLAIFGPQLLGIFTKSQEIISLASLLLWLNIFYDPSRVGNEITIASLNLVGQVKYPVYVGILVTYLFTIPCIYLVTRVFHLQMAYIWLVFIIDEGLRLTLFMRRWMAGGWMSRSN